MTKENGRCVCIIIRGRCSVILFFAMLSDNWAMEQSNSSSPGLDDSSIWNKWQTDGQINQDNYKLIIIPQTGSENLFFQLLGPHFEVQLSSWWGFWQEYWYHHT